MKAFIRQLIAVVLAVSFVPIALAQPNAEEVLSAILDAQRGGQTQRATLTMRVIRLNQEREYSMRVVSDGLERSLIEVTAPSRDAGQAFLQDSDNLFLYNPRLRRSLRIPPSGQSDSFLGSDISYNDLAGRDLETEYSPEISAQTDSTIELTLTPRPGAATPYGQVVLVADAQSYSPQTFTFFDQRGAAVRQLSFSEFVTVDALSVPTHIEVENLLREGERTTVVTSDYAFGVAIPERCFSQQALERGCP